MEDFSLSGVVARGGDCQKKAGLGGVGQFTVWGQSSQGGTRGDLCSEAKKVAGPRGSLDGSSAMEDDSWSVGGV